MQMESDLSPKKVSPLCLSETENYLIMPTSQMSPQFDMRTRAETARMLNAVQRHKGNVLVHIFALKHDSEHLVLK